MMKYLVLAGVLLVVYLLWRAQRRREELDARPPAPPQKPALPQDMVRCPVCALHLPREDALTGGSGRLYCSAEHRSRGGN